MFCEWSDKFLLRIPEIDEEHKELFSLLNQLAAGLEQPEAPLVDLASRLTKSYRKHTVTEEGLLASYNYIGLDKQKKDHANFTRKLEEICDRIQADKSQLSLEVLERIRDEIAAHILGADKAYGEFLKMSGHL